MTKRILAFAIVLVMCLSLLPVSAMAFSPDNFKPKIRKAEFKVPLKIAAGSRALPLKLHFNASENLSDPELVHFVEGTLQATLQDGRKAESIRRLGMTLIGPVKPDVPLDSNMWSWSWSSTDFSGTGIACFEIPLLEDGETQTVEQSPATGMTEVNGLKVGDQVTVQLETVVNTSSFPPEFVEEVFPDGPYVKSDPITFTIEEESKYPKIITPGQEARIAELPEVRTFTYDRKEHTGVLSGEGYTVEGEFSATNAGDYTCFAVLDPGWIWPDGITYPLTVLWQIEPAVISDVTLDNNAFAYDGTKKAPLITEVRAGGLVLKRNEWKVEGTVSETAVGKYSMLVSSKNQNIIGYQSVSWSIVEPCSYELSLPQSLTTIGEAAFAGDRSIPSAYVPDTVSAIGARAFADCTNLSQLRLPKDCDIADGAFDGCTALTTVTAPAGGTAEKWAKENGCTFIAE